MVMAGFCRFPLVEALDQQFIVFRTNGRLSCGDLYSLGDETFGQSPEGDFVGLGAAHGD